MDQIENLQSLIIEPIEELHKEYKYWLDLRNEEHRETLAKAAIAMVNYGGGFIIAGFEQQQGALISKSYPDDIPIITQDSVNNAIQKYAEPRFHCKVRLHTASQHKCVACGYFYTWNTHCTCDEQR